MTIIAFIFIFFLGTLIGSFLNVVIFRLNSGTSFAKGRSICMSCNRTLRPHELIPIFSYLFQKGRCLRCANPISVQYPIIETLTGLIFAFTAFHFLPILPFSWLSYVVLVSVFVFTFSLLIVTVVYDFRHKIIPDKLSYGFSFVALASLFIDYSFVNHIFVLPSIWMLLAGPILALPFALIWLLSKGKWMGLGDAKLILGIGWMLGIHQGLAAIILGFWSGAIVGLILLILKYHKATPKTEIPFAPFLILGVFLVFFFDLDIFSIISWFSVS